MKINTVTRTVKVTISNAEILKFFVRAISGDAADALKSSGKQRTFYRALGHLVGISDENAVQIANSGVKRREYITVDEFREWLPTVFSEFARAMMEANDDTN